MWLIMTISRAQKRVCIPSVLFTGYFGVKPVGLDRVRVAVVTEEVIPNWTFPQQERAVANKG